MAVVGPGYQLVTIAEENDAPLTDVQVLKAPIWGDSEVEKERKPWNVPCLDKLRRRLRILANTGTNVVVEACSSDGVDGDTVGVAPSIELDDTCGIGLKEI